MQDKLISIVIPAYNAEKFIESTIESILNQTYQNFEVIVVNDGSTDMTLEKINKFNDGRIFIINQENKGVSTARNRGLELSKGEYIVFFDADDLMDKYFLESLLNKLNNHSQADFCTSLVIKFYNNVSNIVEIKDGIYNNIAENILLYLPKSTVPSAFMYKRDFLLKHKIIFNPDLSSTADREFLLRVHLAGGSGVISRNAKLYYRIHENSMSFKLTRELINDNIKFYEKINLFEYFKDTKKVDFANFLKLYIIAISYLRIRSLNFFKYFFEFIKEYNLKSFYYVIKWKFFR